MTENTSKDIEIRALKKEVERLNITIEALEATCQELHAKRQAIQVPLDDLKAENRIYSRALDMIVDKLIAKATESSYDR